MTAINVFRQRDRVAVLTDTAGYDADGIVRHFVSKTATIPHLRCVLASRGSGLATALFAANLGAMFDTFDALVKEGGAAAENLYYEHFAALTQVDTEIDLILAGWSESQNRAESYMLASSGRNGFDAWEFVEAPEVLGAPVPDAEAAEAAGLDLSDDPSRVDPVTFGLTLLEAQRSMRFPATSAGGPELHLVGGAAVLTEVRRDGISQRILHRWPDEIGRTIRPEPLAAPAPATRQQRRAAEREARKGRAVA